MSKSICMRCHPVSIGVSSSSGRLVGGSSHSASIASGVEWLVFFVMQVHLPRFIIPHGRNVV